jgi:hypothetical protein
VQEQDEEADHRQLCDEVKAAPSTEEPEPVVAKGRAQAAWLEHVIGGSRSTLGVVDRYQPERRPCRAEHRKEHKGRP